MIHANPATYDTDSSKTPLPARVARTTSGLPAFSPARAYSRPNTSCPVTPHPAAALELREDGEYYIPNFRFGKGAKADPELSEAAEAETEASREAMALLDEAVNLVSVLMASMEDDADDRAAQAETILRIVEKKLNKAHRRIDRQESRHRNLFLTYVELKGHSERDAE